MNWNSRIYLARLAIIVVGIIAVVGCGTLYTKHKRAQQGSEDFLFGKGNPRTSLVQPFLQYRFRTPGWSGRRKSRCNTVNARLDDTHPWLACAVLSTYEQ